MLYYILVQFYFVRRMQNPQPKSQFHCASSIQLTQNQRKQSNILSFINDKNSYKRVEGKRCKPKQLFGYNHESPEQFKSKHALKADFGYIYKFDGNYGNERFEYYSQKHFISLADNPQSNQRQQFLSKFKQSCNQNKLAFHRKKGRLGQFMEKNKWMAPTCIIMGKQRSQSARQCSNKDRNNNIIIKEEQLKLKRKNMGNSQPYKQRSKSSHSRFGQMLITEKMKMRQMRNDFASLHIETNTKSRQKNQEQKRPTTMLSNRSQLNEWDIGANIKLIDNKLRQVHPKVDQWNIEDADKVKIMKSVKPVKTDEWMQTTRGSNFSRPHSVSSYRKRNATRN